MKKICLFSLAVLFLLSVADQGNCNDTVTLKKSLKTVQDCIEISQKAGNFIHQGNMAKAFDLLHSSDYFIRFDIPRNHRQVVITNFTSMQSKLSNEFGERIEGGFEYVGTAKTGKSMLSVYFISKHMFMPIPWKMSFYKPKDEWRFVEFFTGPQLMPELFTFAKEVDVKK